MLTIRKLLLLIVFVWLPAHAEENKTLVWPDGTRYVGGVVDGKRSGKGTIFWQDGTRFVGTFVDDQRDGPGTMILPDGTVYNGFFKNDALVKDSESGAEPTAPIAEISAEDLPETVLTDTAEVAAATEPATPSPAPTTQKSAPQELDGETRQQVQAAIDAWATAWSAQDIQGYLSAYATSFEVPGRQSRRQWEGLRQSRLTRPSRINVNIVYDTFEQIADGKVQVDFNQVYDSNLFSDRTNKRLILTNEAGAWKIHTEKSI